MSANCAFVRLETPAERCTKKAEGSRNTGVATMPASFSESESGRATRASTSLLEPTAASPPPDPMLGGTTTLVSG